MSEIEGTRDDKEAAQDDAQEDLELSAEMADEVSGGDGALHGLPSMKPLPGKIKWE